MVKVEVTSRNGITIETIERNIQIGTKGKLKGKEFVTYKNKRYIAYPHFFGFSINFLGVSK